MQLNDKRPPEGALESHYYGADQMEHVGAVPSPLIVPKISIKMAKHHVISWKILREAWNKADTAKKDFICKGIYKVLNDTDAIPDNEETVRQNVCWSRSNLILGPEGACRLFDPGEGLDFEAPSSIAPDDRVRVELLLQLGALLMEYRAPTGSDSTTWKKSFDDTVDALGKQYRDLCKFDRNAWKLFTKAKLTWAVSGATGLPEVKETQQGFWYRGCVSAECVAKLFPKGATSKNIGLDKVKGQRLTDLNDDLQKNRAATLYKEKLQRDALQSNDHKAMVLAVDELRK